MATRRDLSLYPVPPLAAYAMPGRWRVTYAHPSPVAAGPHARTWCIYDPTGQRVYNRVSIFGGWPSLADALAFIEASARHD